MKELAQRFIDLRKEIKVDDKECSQRQLAKILDIKNSRISDIETGKREATLLELIKYHKYFNVTLEYLIGETDLKQAGSEDICQYTGLNESVVNSLHRMKERSNKSFNRSELEIAQRKVSPNSNLEQVIQDTSKFATKELNTLNFLLSNDWFLKAIGRITRYKDREVSRVSTASLEKRWVEKLKKGDEKAKAVDPDRILRRLDGAYLLSEKEYYVLKYIEDDFMRAVKGYGKEERQQLHDILKTHRGGDNNG